MDVSKYITIPYKEHGRDFSGCDCYGLAMLFYKEEFGIDLPDFTEYSPSFEDYNKEIVRAKPLVGVVKVDVPVEGDLGLLNYLGMPTHVVIYVGNGKILQVTKRTNTVCHSIEHRSTKNRLEGWYRYVR